MRGAALVAAFALSFLVACLALARTPDFQFYDEIWYAGQCANDSTEAVLALRDHPPLGFAIVCSGVRLFGDVPFGWRIGSAVMGALSVAALLTLLLDLRVRLRWVAVAGLFVVSDPLLLVLSRMSMLDSALLFFFVVAVGLFLRSVRDEARELPYLVGTGIAIGAACAVKWSGALLPITFFVYYAFSQRDYQHMKLDARATAALTLVPLLAFVAIHLALGFGPAEFVAFVSAKVRHHVAYSPIGVVRITSRAHEWLVLQKPVPFLPIELARAGGPIVAAGHPIGHAAVLAALLLPPVVRSARTRPAVKLGILLVVVQLVAWAAAPRITFFYYLVTITPFALIAVVDALSRLSYAPMARAGVAALVVAQLAYTGYLMPLLRGQRLTERQVAAYRANPLLEFALRPAPTTPSAAAESR